jgi:arabinose-5-phosphate isomerase
MAPAGARREVEEPHELLLDRAREIVREEGEAVLRKGRQLGQGFVDLARRILRLEGRVVITGVGKSGIIGEKIAATLSSTGTPACFLRPVDALHGDLGMLSPRDLLLAISSSGETAEVLAVVEAAQELGVEIASFTGSPDSSLARRSRFTVDVGVEREACPLGLAPTASTTVTLAVGDALAMVLLEERGFTREHYLRFHPGGNLGARLRFRVRDLMRQGDRIPQVLEGATLAEALREMTRRENIGMTLVVSADGRLRGILTDGDVRRAMLQAAGGDGPPGTGPAAAADLTALPVSRFMTAHPRVIGAEASAADAVRLMEVHGITCLAVVNLKSEPEGVVHLHDILGRGKFSL